MPEAAEYRLSPEAERDLESIWLYTLEEWGVDQANIYADALIAAFAQLAGNPQIGTPCEHIREGYRRKSVGRHAKLTTTKKRHRCCLTSLRWVNFQTQKGSISGRDL